MGARYYLAILIDQQINFTLECRREFRWSNFVYMPCSVFTFHFFLRFYNYYAVRRQSAFNKWRNLKREREKTDSNTLQFFCSIFFLFETKIYCLSMSMGFSLTCQQSTVLLTHAHWYGHWFGVSLVTGNCISINYLLISRITLHAFCELINMCSCLESLFSSLTRSSRWFFPESLALWKLFRNFLLFLAANYAL